MFFAFSVFRGAAATGTVAAALLVASEARAMSLTVRSDAPSCPDTATLAALVNGDESFVEPAAAGAVTVRFASGRDALYATIEDAAGRIRRVDGESHDCAELAEAVAVSLRVLLSQEPAPQPVPARRTSSDERAWRWRGSVGGGISTYTGAVKPLVHVGVGIRQPLETELYGWLSAGRRVRHGPGAVELSTYGIGFAVCVAPLSSAPWFASCAGARAANLTAEAVEYSGFNREVVRWQPSLTGSLKLDSALSDWLGTRLQLRALVPTSHEKFDVQGVDGVALQTPLIGFETTVGVTLTF